MIKLMTLELESLCLRLAELLTALKLCLPDVLVWIQTFSEGDHPTVGLRRLHTLELMKERLLISLSWTSPLLCLPSHV